MFKFNNGNGAVICDKCRIILKENLSYTYYLRKWRNFSKKDYCFKCKKELMPVKHS